MYWLTVVILSYAELKSPLNTYLFLRVRVRLYWRDNWSLTAVESRFADLVWCRDSDLRQSCRARSVNSITLLNQYYCCAFSLCHCLCRRPVPCLATYRPSYKISLVTLLPCSIRLQIIYYLVLSTRLRFHGAPRGPLPSLPALLSPRIVATEMPTA